MLPAMRLLAIRVTLVLLGLLIIPAWLLMAVAASMGALAEGKTAEPSMGDIWATVWSMIVDWGRSIANPDADAEDDVNGF